MTRSRFSPLYVLLFIACVTLLVWLNLPRPELPPQDMGTLLRNPWFIYGFAHFSFLLMPAAALLVADGQRRSSRAWWLVLPYFALGILPLSLYLAARPASERQPAAQWITQALSRRWFWFACALLNVIAAVILLPAGSWAKLQAAMSQSFGWWFMWLDIPLNHVFVLPLVQAHMRHVNAQRQGLWLIAIVLSGPIGLGLYLATHSSKTNTPALCARPTFQKRR
jgi:hypothetical protein